MKKFYKIFSLVFIQILLFSELASAGICLSPQINLPNQLLREHFARKINENKFYQQLLVKLGSLFKDKGACRVIAPNVAAYLFLHNPDELPVLGANEDHLWVETKDYIFDGSRESYILYSIEEHQGTEVFKHWKNTDGIINKNSDLAKQFYRGIKIPIHPNELAQLISGKMPKAMGDMPMSLVSRITNQISRLYVAAENDDQETVPALSKNPHASHAAVTNQPEQLEILQVQLFAFESVEQSI